MYNNYFEFKLRYLKKPEMVFNQSKRIVWAYSFAPKSDSVLLLLKAFSFKGNTTVIFNKNMLISMSIQIFSTYSFCCTIFLIIKISLLHSPLLVSIFNMRRLAWHGNWIKFYVKLAARHAQYKISVNFNFLLDDFLFLSTNFQKTKKNKQNKTKWRKKN